MSPLGFLPSIFASLPNFPGKQRIFKAIFKYIPFRFSKSAYGVLMEKNIDDSTYRASIMGTYGSFISDHINQQDADFIFLDIGANQGIYSILAAQNEHCKSALAFEPNPLTYSFLVRNIHKNNVQEIVFPICSAIADTDIQTLELIVPKAHSGAASIFGKTKDHNSETLKTMVLNKAQLKFLFDFDLKCIAKIDVEGAELLVLETLTKIGALDKIDTIIIEMSENIRGTGYIKSLNTFFKNQGWSEISRAGHDNHYDAIFKKLSS